MGKSYIVLLMRRSCLKQAERDYLTANFEISGGYSRVIKSRLQKKIEFFVNQELPLLLKKAMLQNSVTLQKILMS